MSQKTVVIVDDEMPARQLLKEYLQAHPQLNLVAECKNGVEAVAVLNALKPDLVFLDVQMPGKTGLELLQELEEIPAVIFSTAYDQYALQAFENNAIDYLLKPFTAERFARAVAKWQGQAHQASAPLQALTEQLTNQHFPDRFLVPQGSKWLSVATQQIIAIEASGDYCLLHTAERKHLCTKTLQKVEEKLNPQQFMRVHRGFVVHLSAIAEAVREGSGLQLIMTNGLQIPVSRSYAQAFKERFL